jgi:hypothetical protein
MKLTDREWKQSWSEYPGICLEKAEENQEKNSEQPASGPRF